MSTVKVMFRVPERLDDAIEEFMESEFIVEKSEAVRRLTIAGLKYNKLAVDIEDQRKLINESLRTTQQKDNPSVTQLVTEHGNDLPVAGSVPVGLLYPVSGQSS